jgi:hypothetical protein
MSKSVNFADPGGTGQVNYAVLVSQTGQWFHTVNFALESYNAAHYAFYAVGTTEYGATGVYGVRFDNLGLPEGIYDVLVKRQAGGSPAPGDAVVWSSERAVWAAGSLTSGVIPPSTPGLVTGYLYTYDENGAIQAGVTVTSQVVGFGGSDASVAIQTGFALDETVRTATSDGAGLVSFTNLFKGVVYKFKRGGSQKTYQVEVKATATDPFPLPSIIGAP